MTSSEADMSYLAGFGMLTFVFHANVRFWLKIAAGMGEAWTRDVGNSQEYPVSMVHTVALYRCLESTGRNQTSIACRPP